MTEEKSLAPEATTSHEPTVSDRLDVVDVTSLGGGITLTGEKKVPFTRAAAERFLSLTEVPFERGLRDQHVQVVLNAMNQGAFRWELVDLMQSFCEETQKTYRINGQHTCWARLYLSEEAEASIAPIKILSYNCKTMEDIRNLYGSTDRGAARTRGNVINAHLGGKKLFGGMNERILRTVAAGLAFWLWETPNQRNSHSPDEVAYLLQTDYAKLVSRLIDFLGKSHSFNKNVHMRRAPVFGAMFATFDKSAADAEEFWGCVNEGHGMKTQNDPKLRLRNVLLAHRVSSRTQKEGHTQEEFYRWCIYAWNAFRRGDEIKSLRAMMSGKRPAAK